MKTALSIWMLLAVTASAELRSRAVDYQQGETMLKGFLAYDDSLPGPRPGVLVVHEWWGQNQHARNQAERLAKAGYVAFALDMYGDGAVTTHPEDAGRMSGALRENLPLAKARFLAGKSYLEKLKQVAPDRLVAIGYCFGGGVVLEMARMGVDLDAVVSFHGSLRSVDPRAPRDIKARVLVCHGSEDSFVTAEDIAALKKEMADAEAEFEFLELAGARHSFTNPKADTLGVDGLAYDKKADLDSWAAMLTLFGDVFGSPP